MKSPSCHLALLLALVACGPGARHEPTGDDVHADAAKIPYGPEGTPESCADGFDNEGDGVADCADVDCSGVGQCPVCGDVDVPESQPLALPDGLSSGSGCTMDSQCSIGTPNCIVNAGLTGGGECHASYTSTLLFSGFPTNALLDDPSKLLKVCVNMEHSWLRDIQIDLIPPNGVPFVLDKWYDRTTAEEIYLGNANDSDSAASPVPGTGLDYCWTMNGMYEMINSSTGAVAPTTMGTFPTILSPGDYKTSSPWASLMGVPLNGKWTLRVTDLWGIDNGYIFKWSIQFDPSIIVDCSGPVIQ